MEPLLENFLYYKRNNKYILQNINELSSNELSTKSIALQINTIIGETKTLNLLKEEYLKDIYNSLIKIGFYTDNYEKDIYDKILCFNDKYLFNKFIEWLNSYLLAIKLII